MEGEFILKKLLSGWGSSWRVSLYLKNTLKG